MLPLANGDVLRRRFNNTDASNQARPCPEAKLPSPVDRNSSDVDAAAKAERARERRRYAAEMWSGVVHGADCAFSPHT